VKLAATLKKGAKGAKLEKPQKKWLPLPLLKGAKLAKKLKKNKIRMMMMAAKVAKGVKVNDSHSI
jgi:hypothetical protein